MNHYGKIAAVIFRAAGCGILIYSLVAAVNTVVYYMITTERPEVTGQIALGWLSCLTYAVIGYLLYALSSRLAVFISKGLDSD